MTPGHAKVDPRGESISVMHHTNSKKEETRHMITSTEAGKGFG